ncbi:hypothetical protein GOODEAATRI_004151, partial [Goodea atripinnis]
LEAARRQDLYGRAGWCVMTLLNRYIPRIPPSLRKHVDLAASSFSLFHSAVVLALRTSLLDNSSDGGARSIGCGGSNKRNSHGSLPNTRPFSRTKPGIGASIHGSVSHGRRLPAAAVFPRPGFRTL